jgi:hypothetical protein
VRRNSETQAQRSSATESPVTGDLGKWNLGMRSSSLYKRDRSVHGAPDHRFSCGLLHPGKSRLSIGACINDSPTLPRMPRTAQPVCEWTTRFRPPRHVRRYGLRHYQ